MRCTIVHQRLKKSIKLCVMPYATLSVFHVPISLSVHISLGFPFEPVCLIVPIILYGISYNAILLYRTNATFVAMSFRTSLPIDPYIREFVRTFVHSNHRYFIEFRAIGHARYLYLVFVFIWSYGDSHSSSPSL